MNERIISTLVGLVGSCSNNKKTSNTDTIVMNALLHCYTASDEDTIVNAIIAEKYTISPNCKFCPTPCGNTSDYDMEKFHHNEELKELKEELIKEAVELTKRLASSSKTELPDDIYRAISYFGYDLTPESYKEQINTLKIIK